MKRSKLRETHGAATCEWILHLSLIAIALVPVTSQMTGSLEETFSTTSSMLEAPGPSALYQPGCSKEGGGSCSTIGPGDSKNPGATNPATPHTTSDPR